MTGPHKKTFTDNIREVLSDIDSVDFKKYGKIIVILVFSIGTFLHLSKAAFETKSLDFYAFLTGAKILTEDRRNLYNPHTQFETQEKLFHEGYAYETGFMAFINLPLSAALYVPFLLMPTKVAAELVHAFALLIIIYCIVRLYKFHGIKFISWTTLVLAFFYPIYAATHLGQIGSLIFLVLTEMYIAYMSKKTLRLALLASLLTFKYQYIPFIFLIFAIYPDRKNYLKVAAPLTLLFILVNYLLMGPESVRQYIGLIEMYQSSPTKFGMEYRFGLDIFSSLFYLFQVPEAGRLIFIMTGVLAIFHITTFFVLLSKRFVKHGGAEIFYFCILYNLILSPHTMPADFIFLIIPIVGLLYRIRSKKFYAASAFILSFYFFITCYTAQWTHTFLLTVYAYLLLQVSLKNPGRVGKWVKKSMVGDPGLEPGTARV